jgi:Cd2+/Zn2+-exporting ATPase
MDPSSGEEWNMDSCCDHEKSNKVINITEAKGSGVPSGLITFKVPQMDCASEISLIQSKLEGVPGIRSLKFDLEKRVLTINHDSGQVNAERIIEILSAAGLTASLIETANGLDEHPSSTKSAYLRLGIAGALAIAAEVLELGFEDQKLEWLILALCISAVLMSGIDVYKKGFIALSKGLLNINALMSIAVTGALVIGQWPEAAMVMFLFAVAEMIEVKAFDRARNAFKNLLDLAPDLTTVKNAAGEWEVRPTKDIVMGSIVRVRPGERISLDGIISQGSTSINQAPITGESVPVEKTVGEKVFAGTINEAAEIEVNVTSEASHSTLAKIVETVESAQTARAPTQRFIDQFSKYYTPAVFFLAVAVAVIPPVFLDGGWWDWIYKSLVLLVIACPCALVISTPVTIVSGLSGAAKKGILIKGGAYIEKGARLQTIAMDKTGTITFGKPIQTDFEVINGYAISMARSVAGSLASRSDHPVSHAIASKAQEDGIALHEVENFTAIAGRGTKGTVNGVPYILANHRFVEELQICSPSVESILEKFEREGKTVAILASEKQVIAIFGVIDSIRPTSKGAVSVLHKLGIKAIMLSGDNQLTAEKIAREVGIDEAKGHLLPEDKMEIIKKYSARNEVVGMVGDGINDAPALAIADIGFSMGVAGTDMAIETSDVAIMDDDLGKLPQFIQLSRRTNRVLRQNIALAIGIKAVFFALTLIGMSTMWMAVFADTGASLLVVLNGLRLSR